MAANAAPCQLFFIRVNCRIVEVYKVYVAKIFTFRVSDDSIVFVGVFFLYAHDNRCT